MKSGDIKQLNYEKIKSTASVLFFMQGIEASNMYQIAAASGISKVSIYKHFESKYDIAKEILFDHMEEIAGQMAEDQQGDIEESGAVQMRRLLEKLTMTAQDDMAFFALFLEYGMYLQRSHKSQVPELFERFEAPVKEHFLAILDKGRKDGSLKESVNSRTTFETVTGAIRGTCILFFLKNAGDLTEEFLADLNQRLNLVIDGCMLMMAA